MGNLLQMHIPRCINLTAISEPAWRVNIRYRNMATITAPEFNLQVQHLGLKQEKWTNLWQL